MAAVGIYKIENKINHHIYIGLSNNIFRRWNQHYSTAFEKDPHSDEQCTIHKAICKYKIENFSFEILELCDVQELSDKEIYWISYYKKQGYELYNNTNGGEAACGESNPNAKLTDNDVIDIRTRYNNREHHNDVYELYKNKVSYSQFIFVWQGYCFDHILPEVYTKENVEFHKKDKRYKDRYWNSNFTETDVKRIRDLKKQGMSRKSVQSMFDFINKNTFDDIWYDKTFKEITSDLSQMPKQYSSRDQSGTKNAMSKLSEEDVVLIRTEKLNGANLKEVYKKYSDKIGITSFRKVWNNQSYKNITV